MGDAGTSELLDRLRAVRPCHLRIKNGRAAPDRDGPQTGPPILSKSDRVGNTYVFVGDSSGLLETSFQIWPPRAESKCIFT